MKKYFLLSILFCSINLYSQTSEFEKLFSECNLEYISHDDVNIIFNDKLFPLYNTNYFAMANDLANNTTYHYIYIPLSHLEKKYKYLNIEYKTICEKYLFVPLYKLELKNIILKGIPADEKKISNFGADYIVRLIVYKANCQELTSDLYITVMFNKKYGLVIIVQECQTPVKYLQYLTEDWTRSTRVFYKK